MQTLLKRPDLSVIVPVYNLENFITPLLNSLKEQETGEYTVEYIFVLNNCTDNSEGVIRESGLDCTVINCEEQGCGPARNKGFEIATGEFVWFMDGDDWLTTSTAIKQALDLAQGKNIIRIPFKSNSFYYQYFSMVWQYVFRKEFIEDFRFPSIQPQEDDVYTEQVLRKAGYNKYCHMSVPNTGRPLYYYNYLREGSNMYRVNVLHERL